MERWFDAEKDADYRGVLKVWTEGGRVPLKHEDINTMIRALQASTLRPTVKTQMTSITRAYKLITICVYFMYELDENGISQVVQTSRTVASVTNALIKLSSKILSVFHCTPTDFKAALECVEFIHAKSLDPAVLRSTAGRQWTLIGAAWRASGALKTMYSSWNYLVYRVNQTQHSEAISDVFNILKTMIQQQIYSTMTHVEMIRILTMNFMSVAMMIPHNELVHLQSVVDMAIDHTLHVQLTPELTSRYVDLALGIRKNRITELNLPADDIYAIILFSFKDLMLAANRPAVIQEFINKAVAPASLTKEQWDTLVTDCATVQPSGEVLKDYLDIRMLPGEEDGMRAYAQAFLTKIQPNALYRSLVAPYYILQMRNLNIDVMEQRVLMESKKRVLSLAPQVLKKEDGHSRPIPLLLNKAIDLETACNIYTEYANLRI